MTSEARSSVVLLVPDLAPCGDAAQAMVLAKGLPRDRFQVTVGVLGPLNDPGVNELRSAGVAVHSVPIRHALDLNGVRRLRRTVAEAKTAILHAWGPTAARASRLVVSQRADGVNVPRLVISQSATPGSGLSGWLAVRQLRRADRVVSATRTDGERYRRLGVRGEHLTLIGLAAPVIAGEPDAATMCQSLNVPTAARLLVTGGRAERGIGPKDAIVAFDMLRYDARELHLVVFGAGSGTTALEHFGRALAFDDFRVRFAPCALNRAAAVRMASAVWVTRTHGGADEALEAMAAGKPVVAWNTADLAEVVDDGETGFLVAVGDRAGFAARARLLLDDPALASRLGEAGRLRATERFAPARVIDQFTRMYLEMAN